MVKLVLDFLTCRPHAVRATGALSQKRLSSTGSPQGCVLSPLFYILYTNDCRSNYGGRHLLKFADDTVLISLLQDGEVDHGPVVKDFVERCDLRKTSHSTFLTIIKGSLVELVECYKKLVTVVDKNLNYDL